MQYIGEDKYRKISKNIEITYCDESYLSFVISGLDPNYHRKDRTVWMTLMQKRRGDPDENWQMGVQTSRISVDKELSQDKGLYVLGDGTTFSTYGSDNAPFIFEFNPELDISKYEYKVRFYIAWSPSTLPDLYLDQFYYNINSRSYTLDMVQPQYRWYFEGDNPFWTLDQLRNREKFYVGVPNIYFSEPKIEGPEVNPNYFVNLANIQNAARKFYEIRQEFWNDRTKTYEQLKKDMRDNKYFIPLVKFGTDFDLSQLASLSSAEENWWYDSEEKLETLIFSYFGGRSRMKLLGEFDVVQLSEKKPDVQKSDSIGINPLDWSTLYKDIPVKHAGSTEYKILFPPILESSQPAFDALATKKYEIFFKLSDYVDFSTVGHVAFRIVRQSDNASIVNKKVWPDELIYIPKENIKVYNDGEYYGAYIYMSDLIFKTWEENTYYKIQARLGVSELCNKEDYSSWKEEQIKYGKFSEWSTVMVIKPIIIPEVKILNKNQEKYFFSEVLKKSFNIETIPNPVITALFKNSIKVSQGQEEVLDTYNFDLYKKLDTGEYLFLEKSGDQKYLNNSIRADEGATLTWRFKTELEFDKTYQVVFSIKTLNNYSAQDTYEFKVVETYLDYFNSYPQKATLESIPNPEEGTIDIEIEILNYDFFGNFVLTRRAANSNKWEDIYYFPFYENRFDLPLKIMLFKDYTVEAGVEYVYSLQKHFSTGERSDRLDAKPVAALLEYEYLLGEDRQLKVKFNPKISNFKHTVLSSKQDTIGGKYPLILRNGQVNYTEFQLQGLISLQADDYSSFLDVKKDGLYFKDEHLIPRNKFTSNYDYSANSYYFDTNLTDNNIYIERKYREKVEEFLNNGLPKLYRSSTEGNIIVVLTNVSLSPEEQLGRMLYNFSATAYEVADNNLENLYKLGIITKYETSNTIFSKYTAGQVLGVFESTENIIDYIKKDLEEKRSSQYLKNVCINITELSFEYISKENLEYQINELKYKLLNTRKTNQLQLQELQEKIEHYEKIQEIFKKENLLEFPPYSIVFEDAGTKHTVTSAARSFVVPSLNLDTTSVVKLEYFSDSHKAPIIVNYKAWIDIEEIPEPTFDVAANYKTLTSYNGYFVNENLPAGQNKYFNQLFTYQKAEDTNELELEKYVAIDKDRYYRSFNLMEFMRYQVKKDLTYKLNPDDGVIHDLWIDALETRFQPTGFFRKNNELFMIELFNINDLRVRGDTGIQLGINMGTQNRAPEENTVIGGTDNFKLADTEVSLINENRDLKILNSLPAVYMNLEFVYNVNIIKVDKYTIYEYQQLERKDVQKQ